MVIKAKCRLWRRSSFDNVRYVPFDYMQVDEEGNIKFDNGVEVKRSEYDSYSIELRAEGCHCG